MELITLTNPRSPVSEAYRTLRTNLSFYSLDTPLTSLVVTSAAADEGKSTVIANLAVTMAQSGRSTLLVDCDLRRPSLHEFFDRKLEPGVVNYILDNDTDINIQDTGIENLRLLSSGPKPPNPADLLGTAKLGKLIETLASEADVVLYDAPPVVAVTDAVILGAKVDGVLLVVQAGKTRRDHAERAKELLEKANVRIVGATLTNAPRDKSVEDYYG